MKNLSVGKKMLFGFGLIILLMVLILGVSIVTSTKQNTQLTRIENLTDLQDAANLVKESFLRSRIELRTVYTSSDDSTLEAYGTAKKHLDEAIAGLEKITAVTDKMNREDQEAYGAIAQEMDGMFAQIMERLQNIYQNDLVVMENIQEMMTAFDEMADAATALYDVADGVAYRMIDEDAEEAKSYIKNVVVGAEKLIVDIGEYRVTSAYLLLNQDAGVVAQLQSRIESIQKDLDDIQRHLATPEGRNAAETVQNAVTACRDMVVEVEALFDASDLLIEETQALTNDVDAVIDTGVNAVSAEVNGQVQSMTASSIFVMVLQALIALLAIAVGVLVAVRLTRGITRPLHVMKSVLVQVGETGDMDFDDTAKATLLKEREGADEIAQSIRAFVVMMGNLLKTSEHLTQIADGDLTVAVHPLSPQDTMGNALLHMSDNLNKMFREISDVAVQVTNASNEIAQGAQMLAQGSTQQAATVQEVAAAVDEINGQMQVSRETSEEAARQGDEISRIAQEGSRKMDQMMQATGEINEASAAIGRVISVIDNIAFQTNILALNAAVEAARAGEHGKGFAVVADEVRNLATRSAEAAKETAGLISENIAKAELGLAISRDTAESLARIIEGIHVSGENIQTLAAQSQQAQIATGQVGEAIEQVSHVVQQNSATSEESAAASEEMSGQAQVLQDLIHQFKLKELGGTAPEPFPTGSAAPVPGSGFSL